MGSKMEEQTINNAIKIGVDEGRESRATFCVTNVDEKTLKR